MHYKDLVEFNVKEWDGKPFSAIMEDKEDTPLEEEDLECLRGTREPMQVVGYTNGAWVDSHGCDWAHAYRLEDNKDVLKPKRMTNRQLAMWLAKGNGELSGVNYANVFSKWSYPKEEQDDEVSEGIGVRKWGSDEWVKPTTDLLEGC